MSEQLLEAKKVIDEYLDSASRSGKKDVMVKTLKGLLQVPVTKESLTNTKIGISVNKIRKEAAGEDDVQKAAVEVLSKWKSVMVPATAPTVTKREIEEEPVKEEKPAKAAKTETKEKMESVSITQIDASSSSASTSSSASSMPKVAETPAKPEYLKDYLIGDAVRDKCLEMFVTALLADAPTSSPDELILSTAQSIERSLFNEFSGVTPAYKTKFRSKYLNLKDPKNPTLREALISGMINSDRFIAMTTAEMASDERKSVDAKIAHQNLLNSQMAKDNSAETDQFKCGRCQQRRCKYYQMQTRSADEPMTTFVTCVNCGNRWRFC